MKRMAVFLSLLMFLMAARAFAQEAGWPAGVTLPPRLAPIYPPPDPSLYRHTQVVKSNYGGTGIGSFWIYEPDAPRPDKAPVIAFVPGWTAMNPLHYGAWIEHLVRRGNIVLFLEYQDDSTTPMEEMTGNALADAHLAVDEILHGKREDGTPHVTPDFSRFSLVGHSSGGIIAPNIAALAKASDLPSPQLLFVMTPGRHLASYQNPGRGEIFPLENLAGIDPNTLVFSVAGENDPFYGAKGRDAVEILEKATSVPDNQKFFYLMRHIDSNPAQRSTHFFPSAPNPAYDNGQAEGSNPLGLQARFKRRMQGWMVANNLDYELWRLFDETLQVRFDHGSWDMPVVPFDQLENYMRSYENVDAEALHEQITGGSTGLTSRQAAARARQGRQGRP